MYIFIYLVYDLLLLSLLLGYINTYFLVFIQSEHTTLSSFYYSSRAIQLAGQPGSTTCSLVVPIYSTRYSRYQTILPLVLISSYIEHHLNENHTVYLALRLAYIFTPAHHQHTPPRQHTMLLGICQSTTNIILNISTRAFLVKITSI